MTTVAALDRIWSALESVAPNGRDLRITPEELAVFTMNLLVGCATLADFIWSHLGEILRGEDPDGTPEEQAHWAAFGLVARAMIVDWHRRITP